MKISTPAFEIRRNAKFIGMDEINQITSRYFEFSRLLDSFSFDIEFNPMPSITNMRGATLREGTLSIAEPKARIHGYIKSTGTKVWVSPDDPSQTVLSPPAYTCLVDLLEGMKETGDVNRANWNLGREYFELAIDYISANTTNWDKDDIERVADHITNEIANEQPCKIFTPFEQHGEKVRRVVKGFAKWGAQGKVP